MTPMLRLTGAARRDRAVDVWLDAQPVALGSIARTWFLRMRVALVDAAYADIKERLDLERFIVGARP